MRRRPVCILCMLLVVFLCVTDWLGFSLIRGNPLPQSVQTWIKKHPESTICGEVVRCQENEDFQSVYLKNTYLIYNSEKVSIDNVRVYLKENNKKINYMTFIKKKDINLLNYFNIIKIRLNNFMDKHRFMKFFCH